VYGVFPLKLQLICEFELGKGNSTGATYWSGQLVKLINPSVGYEQEQGNEAERQS
jgi:hypothetical protein